MSLFIINLWDLQQPQNMHLYIPTVLGKMYIITLKEEYVTEIYHSTVCVDYYPSQALTV